MDGGVAVADPPLRVEGIRKSFGGVEVLHGVSLDVPAGSVTALLGENGAGKSTLVKIISGDYQPDAGTITVRGRPSGGLTPIAARSLGLRMIYQELNDAPTLTVAENISLGRLPGRWGFVSWRRVRARARRILAELEVELDPDAPMGSLRVGERQLVEIARSLTHDEQALADDAHVLILDEPTAALSNDEVDTLFGFVRRLRERGTAMIYITHRLDEVRRIADRVAVLRDGTLVLHGPVPDYGRSELVHAMVGAAIEDVGRPPQFGSDPVGPPALWLQGAGSGSGFADVTLEVRPGEVVGLYGKLGSGLAEVAAAVYGLLPITTGTAEVFGRRAPANPRQAVARGVGYLPADRKREGAFLELSGARNLAAPVWGRQAAGGVWLSARTEAAAFEHWRTALDVRVPPAGAHRPIATLSGGNQQKVLLARWLHAGSRLLVLVEPTRGVDIGARQEIYATLRRLAESGAAVLVASSDYEEIVQLADRAVVMSRGRVVRELGSDEISVGTLTDAAGG